MHLSLKARRWNASAPPHSYNSKSCFSPKILEGPRITRNNANILRALHATNLELPSLNSAMRGVVSDFSLALFACFVGGQSFGYGCAAPGNSRFPSRVPT